MNLSQYLDRISNRFKTGISTEHTYRGDLQTLLESLATDVEITNEPSRIACGAPDYIITKRGIPVGYIEAKDIGIDLKSKQLKEQFERYKGSLNNLIITDYLDFHLYVDGEYKTSVRIGRIDEYKKLVPIPEHFETFESLIKNFCTYEGQTIKSAKKLAEMMAGKAKLLAVVIESALNADLHPEQNDVNADANNTLREQLKAFQDILIHDIKPKEFADIYAQTIAYGMFAARLHDPDLSTFSRVEAAEQIPKSNPFLRKLFQYIAGYDLDSRINWIVDALADIFRATDVKALVTNFGKATRQHDPIIHFYETFLSAYDPKLRKSRGVWYTPEPVVNFIVRAVDDILKTEFDLPKGLADNSKTKIKIDVHGKKVEREVHKVQILDPATGTGTFLAEVIKQVHTNFESQQGIWSNYVENHLIPRLNGFELLMASYAMAHLKLDLLLTETGYKPTKDQRFRVYLTNSLEEHHPETGTLFAGWLSAEANEANHIKRDTPVMVILGNPPYNGESKNHGKWILNLMESYKKEPGGTQKLKEKNSKWINDDYVKFLRFGQHFIDKNGSGILAFINPHGFINNPTFRGMRWSLISTYDKIYTIDLHGSNKKKEKAIDGSVDENVFDIMQGVSINLFIKTGKKQSSDFAHVFNFDIFGKREDKYSFLLDNSLSDIPFKELTLVGPEFVMKDYDFGLKEHYNSGFSLNELFQINGNGMVSKRDEIAFKDTKEEIRAIVQEIANLKIEEIPKKFGNVKWESRDGKAEFVKQNVMDFGLRDELFVQCEYRPFDLKWTYYTGKSKGFIGWPVNQIMRNYLNQNNVGLVIGRQGQAVGAMPWNLCFITKNITDFNLFYRGGGMSFPLYLYPQTTTQQSILTNSERLPNFNSETCKLISDKLGMTLVTEKINAENSYAPIDLLDFIYAILHSPSYREKYKEFLKIDFPRIPYPKDKNIFWQMVRLGSQIREIHLLESSVVETFITKYPVDGSNMVKKPTYKDGQVWINEFQYFDKVPQIAWEFYIGGYQPAQKWLKDRKDRELSFDEIQHYQKIIVALAETYRLMKEIDKIVIEYQILR